MIKINSNKAKKELTKEQEKELLKYLKGKIKIMRKLAKAQQELADILND